MTGYSVNLKISFLPTEKIEAYVKKMLLGFLPPLLCVSTALFSREPLGGRGGR